jgi:hypothetical protein
VFDRRKLNLKTLIQRLKGEEMVNRDPNRKNLYYIIDELNIPRRKNI